MEFRELMKELGEKLGIALDGSDDAVGLAVEDTAVIMQLAGGLDGDILFTHADLGEPPMEGRDALAVAALEANFLYQGTGGATFAINSADGHLHLQRYDWLARLDADRAADALTRFADTIAAWRRIAADLGQAPSAEQATSDKKESPSAPGAASEGDFIKV